MTRSELRPIGRANQPWLPVATSSTQDDARWLSTCPQVGSPHYRCGQLRATSRWRGPPRAPRQPLRLIAEPLHDLGGLTDVRLAQLVANRRGDRQEPRAQLAVTRMTLASMAHQL